MKHCKSSVHIANMGQVQTNNRLDEMIGSNLSCIKAELNLFALIARKNISFNVMSSLVPVLQHIGNDSKAIKEMTCGRTKATYLMTECLTVNAHEMLIRQLEKASGFSILCDKATDITMKKIFCINVRYFFHGKATTHLYRLVSLTSGNAEALFNVLLELFDGDKLPWN